MDANTIKINVDEIVVALLREEPGPPPLALGALLTTFLINQQRTADALEKIAAAVEEWIKDPACRTF
jgi:hypothetical protein